MVHRLGADAFENGVWKDVFSMRVNYGVDVWVCFQYRRVDIAFGVTTYGTIHRRAISNKVLADVCWSRYHCWACEEISMYELAT
jgi:hypothetical protein